MLSATVALRIVLENARQAGRKPIPESRLGPTPLLARRARVRSVPEGAPRVVHPGPRTQGRAPRAVHSGPCTQGGVSLGRTPGPHTWVAHLGRTPGSHTWVAHLGRTPGSHTWVARPGPRAQGRTPRPHTPGRRSRVAPPGRTPGSRAQGGVSQGGSSQDATEGGGSRVVCPKAQPKARPVYTTAESNPHPGGDPTPPPTAPPTAPTDPTWSGASQRRSAFSSTTGRQVGVDAGEGSGGGVPQRGGGQFDGPAAARSPPGTASSTSSTAAAARPVSTPVLQRRHRDTSLWITAARCPVAALPPTQPAGSGRAFPLFSGFRRTLPSLLSRRAARPGWPCPQLVPLDGRVLTLGFDAEGRRVGQVVQCLSVSRRTVAPVNSSTMARFGAE
ncbi:hypothetical protein BZB76_0852 [Actinomadura pelletieri DSM 43383]|uniref:Uncharacterized protein n=1 Tax=Actinomadura pelletieri DSM 43383 TaxID=1120940 RepID=A0A495QZA0_9ACTN|nr:hypothetical protein BZB76_0852 [Actinomadura pelletieri DSM 43383]